jgi:hypothetical protein
MAYDEMIMAYVIYCSRGIPSKFDSPFWLDLDPTPNLAHPPAVVTLRQVAYRLFIMLPGLAVLVRKLRKGLDTDIDNSTLRSAFALAQRCLAERDETAENLLLHSVRVTKPQESTTTSIVPAVMKFSTLVEFEAAVNYWQTNILLNRLCLILQTLHPDHRYFDQENMNAQNRRLAINLLMSWEAAFDHGALGKVPGGPRSMAYTSSMIAVWGVLTDLDTLQGQSRDTLRQWVLQHVQMIPGREVMLTAQHMDETADMLAGGPVQGLLPTLVGGGRV